MDVSTLSQLAGAAPLAEPITQAGIATPPLPPDDGVVGDFQHALQGAPAAAAPVDGKPPAASGKPANLGESILGSLDRLAGDTHQAWQRLQQAPGSMSMQEIVRLQQDFLTFGVTYDILGKGVSKAVQDLDTVLKQQ